MSNVGIERMSKQQVNARVPGDLHQEIEDYVDEHGVDKAEAARQLLRRGAEDRGEELPGETLMRQASTISIVLAVVSGMLIVMPGGPAWSLGAAMAGVASTTIFGVLWLGVRAIAGRGDWV